MKQVLFPLAMVLLAAACSSSSLHGSVNGSTTVPSTTGATPTTLSSAEIAINAEALKKATVESCAPNQAHDLEVKGTIKNTTADRSTFVMQISIGDKAGKRLYATAAMAGDVAPNQTATWDATTTAKYVAGMTCKVESVSRHLAP